MNDLAWLLWKNGCVRELNTTLSSGTRVTHYVDIKIASTRAALLKQLAQALAHHTDDCDKLAGLETGSIPIMAAISMVSGRSFLMLRTKPKEYGTRLRVEGTFERGDQIVLVDDTATTGRTLVQAINIVRHEGMRVDRAVVVLDREMGAEAELRKLEVRLHSLMKLRDFEDIEPRVVPCREVVT